MNKDNKDIEDIYAEEESGHDFHKGLLGMILAGLGLVGIIFSMLIHWGFDSFYGKLGIGASNVLIPFSLSILMIIIGTFLLITGQKEVNEDL